MKRKTREEKWKELSIELINEMFRIAGHDVTYDDIAGRQDDWYTNWTMTFEQSKAWEKWGTEVIRKKMRLTKKYADREMGFFSMGFGLSFSDYPYPVNKVETDNSDTEHKL
jgi:hypothetical protein